MPGPQTSSDLDPLWPSSKGSSTRAIRRAPGDFPLKGCANRNAQRLSVKGRVRQLVSLHISNGATQLRSNSAKRPSVTPSPKSAEIQTSVVSLRQTRPARAWTPCPCWGNWSAASSTTVSILEEHSRTPPSAPPSCWGAWTTPRTSARECSAREPPRPSRTRSCARCLPTRR